MMVIKVKYTLPPTTTNILYMALITIYGVFIEHSIKQQTILVKIDALKVKIRPLSLTHRLVGIKKARVNAAEFLLLQKCIKFSPLLVLFFADVNFID